MTSGLLAGLLPAGVETAQSPGPLDVPLLPAEEAYAAAMAAGRRAEFATGRACARVALSRLGLAAVPLLPDERGAATWPAGVVGSLTHCPGLWVAAVARSTDLAGLGIDAEPHAALPDGVLPVVATATERRHLAALARTHPGVAWDRLLFSAKESVYKLWSPATGRWLDFEQVEVRLRPDGHLTARLPPVGPVLNGRRTQQVSGRWAADARHLVTAVAPVVR